MKEPTPQELGIEPQEPGTGSAGLLGSESASGTKESSVAERLSFTSSPALPVPGASYVVEVVNLVKEFRVYHRSFGSLKSHAAALAKTLVRRETQSGFDTRRALGGVSFQIAAGEAVALVGRNGSGKSTLLSILSRIYLPTSGEARLRGRMISLLELGAGFDPELTGAQNVFFNGVILGLSEEEVAASYDAILEFAELDRETMDLPVRMYSSGMQLRLGFAIAVHLQADLLLIDEGLAVGDEGFQEKCFRKIEDFKTEGKTILMVTHELDHVERLADRVLWLDGGVVRRDGPVADVLAEYRANFSHAS